MATKKKILLVSATREKNYELAQELKEIIDNTTAEEVINEVNNEGSVKSNLNLLCSLYVDSIFIQDKSK